MDYPEHEKLAKVSDKSQVIGEFCEWLGEQGYCLAAYDDRYYSGRFLFNDGWDTQRRLAEFFDIDRGKLEAEKRQMLDEIRSTQ